MPNLMHKYVFNKGTERLIAGCPLSQYRPAVEEHHMSGWRGTSSTLFLSRLTPW